jgi:tetraacyldisaccharide 4'-kinase
MKLSLPFFWKKRHFISYLLLPLSYIYMFVFILQAKRPRKKTVFLAPLITIGNATIGGAGKTPTAIALGELLKANNKNICFLSKGYLGNINQPTMVNGSFHQSKQVGDEALLLSKHGNVIISKKRYLAQKLIARLKPDLVIMDDGLQNNHLKHQLKILVIDAGFLFGNGFLLPAGPLRESLKSALQRVDYIIYIGKRASLNKIPNYQRYQRKIFSGEYIAKKTHNKWDKYLAFSALANNQKFFNHLEEQGYNLIVTKEFPDHYFYSNEDLIDLINLAQRRNLKLITTSKDMVKIDKKFLSDIIVHEIILK